MCSLSTRIQPRDERILAHLKFLDWQLIRLAFTLRCLPGCWRLGRAAYLALSRVLQLLLQAGVNPFDVSLAVGSDYSMGATLMAERETELAHVRLLLEHAVAKLHLIRDELASLEVDHHEFEVDG